MLLLCKKKRRIDDLIHKEPSDVFRGDFLHRLSIGDVYEPFIDFISEYPYQVLLSHYFCEADELWAYVQNKSNKQWVWLAMHSSTRQIIGFHVGKRSKEDAECLWNSIPEWFRQKATFFTDHLASYKSVIPFEQHISVDKGTGLTNYQERFNLTLRQRVSRLARANLAFSKKKENHIGAIKHFLCYHNKKMADEIRAKK